MRRLILMRHAKSSWDDLSLADHDRPLNARGRKSAKAIGAWLTAQNALPEQTLCSSAGRTRETFARLGLPAHEVSYHEALYHASEGKMLRCLQREGRGMTVLMLGHNPGIAFFAESLLAQPPEHAKFALFPTTATLIAEFDIEDWGALRLGQGRAAAFTVPRDLLS